MTLIREIDYGTPASKAEAMVTLTIDGEQVTVPAGTSIMRAAMMMGTEIPKLCASDMLESFGSCRVCLVEIEGRAGTPASCTTPVAEGIVVHTQTERLARIRRGVMELYASDHPDHGLTDPASAVSEMRDVAAAVGLSAVRYAPGANHVAAECFDASNPLHMAMDGSNPYFVYDPAKCIVCYRCVRACDEVQGTYALTIEGRGFESRMVAGMNEEYVASECVSCGACVQACPTGSLAEKALYEIGVPEHSKITTCAYCGVGCAFKAEMRGEEVVRMMPWKDGKANRGHSCVKGRFAYGYATHPERILAPMVRDKITDPWRETTWEEAIGRVASEFRRIQAEHGKGAVGGITSSRCTNEETFLVQKLIRQGFGVNNVDTCARVCHSPTGYGLKATFGESAGTQDFDSVEAADVMFVIGANPTDGHPVFASRMKRRLKEGARLIVADPRRIDLVRMPHVEADYHLALTPGTNVALLTAMAHVVVTEGLVDEDFVRARCDWDEFQEWAAFVARPDHSPEASAEHTGVDPGDGAGGGAALRDRGERRDLLRPRGDRAQPGVDDGDGDRQPGDGDRQHRAAGGRGEPAARAEQRAGRLRHGVVPARALRATATSPTRRCAGCSRRNGASPSTASRACGSRTCSTRRSRGRSGRSTSRARTSCSRTRTRRTSRPGWRRWTAWWCRTCS